MEYKCPFCSFLIKVEYPNIIHSGFNNSGFMYCNTCNNLLTWSSFDPTYEKILGDKHPWLLTDEEKQKIEDAVISCECGGKFTFSAKPRCPNCNNEIPDILPDQIHYVVVGKVIDADTGKAKIWKNQ